MTISATCPRLLYLDLLKRSLTNTIHQPEPEPNTADDPRALYRFAQHYIKGMAVTMLPLCRLNNLQSCMIDVIEKGVQGDVIETGVWRGGSTILMRAILKTYGVADRVVWVADLFEGLPEPDPKKFPLEAKAHHGAIMTKSYNHFAVGLEDVKRNFEAYGLLDDRVRFLKGWFKDTLPVAPIEKLAIMRLDGDYYELTRDGLVNLYNKLSVGGYVIVDDYGEDLWTYCRQAVDEFRSERNIREPMTTVDAKCSFWQKRE